MSENVCPKNPYKCHYFLDSMFDIELDLDVNPDEVNMLQSVNKCVIKCL